LDEIRKRGVEAEAIGGLTLGADPIVASVASVSHIETGFSPLAGFIVRKEEKKHGTQRFIEGFDKEPGTPVVIIDDVCTTGGSTLKAVNRAEEAGYRVAAVLCLVDREQGGTQALRDYPFYPIFTARQLLDDPGIREELAKL
jgi:orotate phosphoribosyltransferase